MKFKFGHCVRRRLWHICNCFDIGVLRNLRCTTCKAAEHVKFLSLSSTIETLDSPILLSRSFKKCVAAFVALLSASYFPISALFCMEVLYLPRGDRVTGFKSPDREHFTGLFASSISFPG